MRYEGTVIRPPSEADSFILQVTLGCSHNRCTFCPAYLDKKFRVRDLDKVFEDIEEGAGLLGDVRRVFLADGDALILPTEDLLAILERLAGAFPSLSRVGIYANAQNVSEKTDEELRTLAEHKLGIAYLGLESGDGRVLERVRKGATAAEMAEAVCRLQAAGIKASVIVLLGLAGREGSADHARATAEVVSRMNPRYLSFLTVMVVPGTALHRQMERGEFGPMEPRELLAELRQMIEPLDLKGTIVRSNHASNYVPIGGRLPKDKDELLRQIDEALRGETSLRPEWTRGL